jgi:hypothetical protein
VRPCPAAVVPVKALDAPDDCMECASSRGYQRDRLAAFATSARPYLAGIRGSWHLLADDTRLFVGTSRPCDPILARYPWAYGDAV